jgi:hypothetical protein
MHELLNVPIDFCNLGPRKPAGFAQCPQFSVRTRHGCVRSFKAVAEIADILSHPSQRRCLAIQEGWAAADLGLERKTIVLEQGFQRGAFAFALSGQFLDR